MYYFLKILAVWCLLDSWSINSLHCEISYIVPIPKSSYMGSQICTTILGV